MSTGCDRASIAPKLARVEGATFRELNGCGDEDGEESDERIEDGITDLWLEKSEKTVRRHRRPRRSLFTPLRVSGAPPAKSLTPVRITEGKFCDDGEPFRVVDCWTSRATAHRPLERAWIGLTTFLTRSEE